MITRHVPLDVEHYPVRRHARRLAFLAGVVIGLVVGLVSSMLMR